MVRQNWSYQNFSMDHRIIYFNLFLCALVINTYVDISFKIALYHKPSSVSALIHMFCQLLGRGAASLRGLRYLCIGQSSRVFLVLKFKTTYHVFLSINIRKYWCIDILFTLWNALHIDSHLTINLEKIIWKNIKVSNPSNASFWFRTTTRF